jgi:hypothetical protein
VQHYAWLRVLNPLYSFITKDNGTVWQKWQASRHSAMEPNAVPPNRAWAKSPSTPVEEGCCCDVSGKVPHIKHFRGHTWCLSRSHNPTQLRNLGAVLYSHSLLFLLSFYLRQVHSNFSLIQYKQNSNYRSIVGYSTPEAAMLLQELRIFLIERRG